MREMKMKMKLNAQNAMLKRLKNFSTLDGQTDRQADKQTDRQTDRQVYVRAYSSIQRCASAWRDAMLSVAEH